MNIIKSDKGVTLVALVITIIVLLVLAAVSLGAIADDGILENAVAAKLETEVASIVEHWHMERADKEIRDISPSTMNYTLREALPNYEISDDLNKKLKIKNGNIVYIPAECTDDEEKALERMQIFAE